MEGQSEVAVSDFCYPSTYKFIAEWKFKFFDENFSKSSTTYNLEPGLYTSIKDNGETFNTLFQKRNKYNKTCITVKVSRRTQKTVIMPANDTSRLAFCSTDLGRIFGNNVGNDFWVLMIGKGPQEPGFAYDFVRIHSLMIYSSDPVEYNIVGDRKAPLLRCFPFISKLKAGRHYKIWTVSTWTIRHSVTYSLDLCSKIPFTVYTSIWETNLVKKYPLYLLISLGLFWCLKRWPTFISSTYGTTRWLLQNK